MHVGFSSFGTRVTIVALTHRGRALLEKKYLTAARKSTLIMSQHFLKKRALYPSGPGDLLSGIENKADLISSLVIGAMQDVLEASDILFGKMFITSAGCVQCGAVSKRSKYMAAMFPISC